MIEIVSDVIDRIRGVERVVGEIESVEEVEDKLMKIKGSLLTNVLTLKVLGSVFEARGHSVN